MADNVDKAADVATGLTIVAILLGVLLLVVAIVITTVIDANTSLNGANLSTVNIVNETGAFANYSGYTVSGASAYGFVSPNLVGVINTTTNGTIALGNFSLSSAGILTNATAAEFSALDIAISYNYKYDTTSGTDVNTGLNAMQDGIFGLVNNFFSLAPTIGTILAVIILIAGIVLLVLYVKNMKDAGDSSNTLGFQG